MTDPLRAIRVADPVHGYVLLTSIERTLIDTRPAQRLRYVAQSGLAHLVFPEVRTSRFSHSLGTMHLASRFLAASLTGAEPEARDAAQQAIQHAVGTAIGNIGSAELAAGQLLQDGLLAADAADDHFRPYVLLAEQGLRLAALFHDLGHLPFSHDFEYAVGQLTRDPETEARDRARPLLEQRPGLDALHERIGHDLTFLLFNAVFADAPGEAARVSFAIARYILESSEAQTAARIRDTGGLETRAEGAFAWLHTLIAGELDVDRCDYVLRDARNYGFEFAIYDLERLIDNLTVVMDPDAENALLPAIRPQGQPAVETFLIARARMYQWGVRHHKVAQVGAALRYTIAELLRPALASAGQGHEHPLGQFLVDMETVLTAGHGGRPDPELLNRFATYDDGWWMSFMRERAAEHPDDEWAQLVCWRARGPRSLWKRAMQFPVDLRDFNGRLPKRTDIQARAAFDDAVRGLRDDGVLIVLHSFAPWKASSATEGTETPQSALSFFDPEHGLTPVSVASYPIASLREAWMHDVQVHAFARSDVQLTPADVIERLEQATPEA